MKLEEATMFANRVLHCIEHLCDKIQVVGSIRRKRPEPRDIDIVLIPQAWMWNTIICCLKDNMLARVVKAGKELARLKVPIGSTTETMQVDLYRARPETWGVLLLIRTGSTEHNVMMCQRARTLDMMLSASRGVIKDGKVIASRSEKEIFQALGLDYISPHERDGETQ